MKVTGSLLRADGSFAPGWLELEDGRVVDRGDGGRGGDLVAPGLCDLQVNGAAGADVTEGPDALARVDAAMLDAGVTSYLATVMTTDDDTATQAVGDAGVLVADAASPLDGVHLEGPFLSPSFPGTHRPEHLRRPADGVPEYVRSPVVRLVTLAPELDGATVLARELAARGVVVSLGHSDAEPSLADETPARMVTHVFNGMRPLHHRRATLPVWALTSPAVAVGVIPDGVHVGPRVLELVRRAAGDRVVLVSDASPAAAAEPGRYSLQGIPIERVGDECRNAGGRLAGSAIRADEGMRRWSRFTGADLGESLLAASVRPARLAGIGGALEPGDPADLVVLDGDGVVQRVMRRGVWVRV